MARLTARAAAPPDVVLGYLADPANRPQWQSSLRRVADLVPAPTGAHDAGTRWTDVTVVPGVRPRMRTTASTARHWAEEGDFGPFRATLTLDVLATATGTLVAADFTVTGLGLGPLLTALARPAVAADLRRAGLLAARRA